MPDDDVARRAAGLRDAFDSAFAEVPGAAADALEKFLVVRANGSAYAFRLVEIAGVAVDRRLTAVPGPLPELLGLTGVRGKLLPVYSLTALLGGPKEHAAPRWLVLVEREHVALAIETLDGYVFGRRTDLLPAYGNGSPHCSEILRLESGSYGILSVPSIVKEITSRVASLRPRQEH